jgi:hypothetical protein
MAALARAKLFELNQRFTDVKPGGREVEVQFNPESLKVTFANQIVEPKGGNQAAGNAGRQFVGAGTTKLALTLWFDVTSVEAGKDSVDDVRRLTQMVVYFMQPQTSDNDPRDLAPPGVRFQWGSFIFDGMVDGLEETLEFFSPDGKPLRASISLSFSQQKILNTEFEGNGRVPARQVAAKQNESVAGMAGRGGRKDWQGIAAANGIEDPLRLPAGQLVNLNAGLGVGGGLSAGGSLGGSFGGSASGSIAGSVGSGGALGFGGGGGVGASLRGGVSGGGLNASLGGAVSGSVSFG